NGTKPPKHKSTLQDQRELEAVRAYAAEIETAREHDGDLAEKLQAAKARMARLESENEEMSSVAGTDRGDMVQQERYVGTRVEGAGGVVGGGGRKLFRNVQREGLPAPPRPPAEGAASGGGASPHRRPRQRRPRGIGREDEGDAGGDRLRKDNDRGRPGGGGRRHPGDDGGARSRPRLRPDARLLATRSGDAMSLTATTRPTQGGSRIKRRRATKAEMEKRAEFLINYADAHGPISVRGLYYQADVRCIPGITKDDKDYDKIQRQVLQLRREGRLAYEHIA